MRAGRRVQGLGGPRAVTSTKTSARACDACSCICVWAMGFAGAKIGPLPGEGRRERGAGPRVQEREGGRR